MYTCHNWIIHAKWLTNNRELAFSATEYGYSPKQAKQRLLLKYPFIFNLQIQGIDTYSYDYEFNWSK
jgi:hypothetical protein